MKRFERVTGILMIAAMISFLAAAGAITALGGVNTYSYYENRALADFPEMTSENIMNGDFFTDAETFLREQSAGRETVLKLSMLADLYVFRRPVVADTVIAGDTLLPYLEYEPYTDAERESLAEREAQILLGHMNACAEYGGKFYYIAVPTQDMAFEDEIPDCIGRRSDGLRADKAALLERLGEYGVEYIDMEAVYSAASGDGIGEFYMKTDHHYNFRGAYEVYGEIIDRVNADTEMRLEKAAYEPVTLENDFLGSRSRKLCGLFVTDEKLLYMKDDGLVAKRWFYGDEVAASLYEFPAGTDTVTYDFYMGGDCASTTVDTGRELPTVFVYGDSFTNSVECLLPYSFGIVRSADFRGFDSMTVDEYITAFKPDVVVCIRDMSVMLSEDGNGR